MRMEREGLPSKLTAGWFQVAPAQRNSKSEEGLSSEDVRSTSRKSQYCAWNIWRR